MTSSKLAQALFEQCMVDETIYSFSTLLESRIDFIKQKHNGKMDALVDHISTHIDPTKNKKFTEWLVDRHLKGDDIHAPDVKESLQWFDKASSDVHDTNIKNHTLDSVRDVAHLVKTSPKTKKASTGLEKIYDEAGVQGYRVPDAETSRKLYGHGTNHSTNWCTAANGTTNMFDHYAGGKYTMHFPNGNFLQLHHGSGQLKDPSNTEIELHSDDRYHEYAPHIEKFMKQTSELEDAGDSLRRRHFGLGQEEYNQAWEKYKHPTDYVEKANAAAAISDHIHRMPVTDEHFDLAMKHGGGMWRGLVSNGNLSPERLTTALGDSVHNPASFPEKALRNPALKGDALDAVVTSHLHFNDGRHAYKLDRIRNLEDRHVNQVIDVASDPTKPTKAAEADDAIFNILDSGPPKLTDQTIERIHQLDPKSTISILKVGAKQKLPEHFRQHGVNFLKRAIQNNFPASARLMPGFSEHNEIHSHEIDQMLDEVHGRKDKFNLPVGTVGLTQLPNFNEHHSERLKNIIKDSGSDFNPVYVPSTLYSSPGMKTEHVEELLKNQTTPSIADHEAYLSRKGADPKLTLDFMKSKYKHAAATRLNSMKFYQRKDMPHELIHDSESAPYIAANIQHHPGLKAHHIDTLIDSLRKWSNENHSFPSSTTVAKVLSHPATTTDHINKLLNHYGKDWMVKDAVEQHPRTPPSVHKRLMTTDFWQAED